MKGWRAVLLGAGGLTLLLAAFWLGRASVEPARTPDPVAAQAVGDEGDALGQQLAAERERARELAAQVAWLQGQMARLGREVAMDEALEEEAADPAETESDAPAQREPGRWFGAQELLELGMPEAEVTRLEGLFNDYEMKRIELQHRAQREGWGRTQRYWNEMIQFQLGMREEIGDENYDVMLYATGRKNRVVMGELLEGSPAESYGFEPGDVVIGYEGERIFHGRELRRATAQGERGDWVTVDVLREGEPLRIRAQRGPLGVKLQPARILPQSLW